MENIWGENPEVDKKMEAELAELLDSMSDPWQKIVLTKKSNNTNCNK